tara:strand:+ start:99 stop:560 length:462 start_codon:yes stop_codon:yes gene_type:complete
MAKMYSYDDVMELLEVQRKSVMEFEAAKNKLLVSGLIEKSDILAEKLNTMKTKNKNLLGKVVEIQTELKLLRKSTIRADDNVMSDIDEVHATLDALDKWTPESIHEAVLKIKTDADVGNPSIWRDWVLMTLGGPKKKKHWNTPNLIHLKPLDK